MSLPGLKFDFGETDEGNILSGRGDRPCPFEKLTGLVNEYHETGNLEVLNEMGV